MSYGYQGPPVAPFQGRPKAPTSFGAPPGTPSAPGAPPYSNSSNVGFAHPPNSFGMPQPYGGYGACPYPPQSQPPQSAPYPGPASGINTAPYPQQTSPYSVQNTPYPAQNSPYPAQNSPYPAQNSPYPAQNSPYPAQNSPYPAQNSPYPAQNSPYPAQNSPYPAQNSPHPSQNPYPSQTSSYGSHNSSQSSPYRQQTNAYTGQAPQPTSPYPQAPSAQQAYPSGQHSQMNPYPAAPTNQTSSISRGSPYPGSANILSQLANASFPSANNAYSGGAYPGGQGRGGSPYSSRAAASSYTLPQQISPAPRRAQITRKLSPTVVPYPDFDPRDDAAVLRKAMKGFGTDDKALIHVLANRSNLQRQEIATQFKTLYGKDLIKDLKSETSGNFEKLLVAMMTPLPQYYAKELHDALACLGTEESVLIEVLCTLSNHEIRIIKQAYEAMYGQPLEDDLIDDTSGNFKRLMVSLCCANRDESFDVDPEQAYNDARDLLQAGELRMGTDESTFNAILVQRNLPQLQQIFASYADITGHDIETAIEREFSGDIKKGLMAIVKCTKNRAGFFAELLYKSMKGFGTNDRRLIRLITTRSEVDLGEIKQAFLQEYGESLESFISDDCSGNYKACLLTLVS